MGRPSRFSPKVRQRAVRIVEEHRAPTRQKWAVLLSIAPKLGASAETLRAGVRQAQRDAAIGPGSTTCEGEGSRRWERVVRELERANETLRKAAAYFSHESATAEQVADGVADRRAPGAVRG